LESNKKSLRPILEINLAMLFISTSGVLGRYIQLPPELIIGLRGIFAAFFLGLILLWRKSSVHIVSKDRIIIFIGSALLGAHWVLYFYALQLSSVAIGMLSVFTYPVITSLLEPLILKTKFQFIHIMLAIVVMIGLYFLVPHESTDSDVTLAIVLGVLSALCYSIRNIIMKPKLQKYEGTSLMFYQIVIVSVLLIPVFFTEIEWNSVYTQLPYIALLGLLTTSIGHTLFLMSFKNFSVTTASLISGVQPIYGILLAVIFLSEIPSFRTIIGGILILTSVFIESKRVLK
jgi:drug/metabolite transporter (DMT)-like permease